MSSAHSQWMASWTRNSHHPEAASLLSRAHEMLVEAEEDGTRELVPAALALVRQAYERPHPLGENPAYGPGNPDWEHDRSREEADL